MAGNPRIDDLRRRIEKDPRSRLFAQLAEELRKDGDLAEAIQVAREGLKNHSTYASARLTLGRALMDTGDIQAARVELEAAVQGAPDNILAGRLLAECLESEGRLEDAAARYRTILALSAGDPQVSAHLAALEERIRGKALAGRAAPIPVTEVDADMELEAAYERPSSFSVRALDDEDEVFEAGQVEPPPIPLVEASEEFELERPYDALAARAPIPMPVPLPEDLSPASEPAAPPSPPEPPSPPAPPAPPDPAAAAESAPDINSSTLAELYFNQGFTDQAVEVYRRIAEREPGNERVQARLRELETLNRHLHGQAAAPPAATGASADPQARAARRAALERTIERLQGLQAAFRRG